MAFTFVKIYPIVHPSGDVSEWVVPAINKGQDAKTFVDVWEALDWAEFECEKYNENSPHRKQAIINSVSFTTKLGHVNLGDKARARLGFESDKGIPVVLNVYNVRREIKLGSSAAHFGTVFGNGESASVNYRGRSSSFNPATAVDSEWSKSDTLKLKEIYNIPKNRFKYPDDFLVAKLSNVPNINTIEGLTDKIRRDWYKLGLSTDKMAKTFQEIGNSFSTTTTPLYTYGGSVPQSILQPVRMVEDRPQFRMDFNIEVAENNMMQERPPVLRQEPFPPIGAPMRFGDDYIDEPEIAPIYPEWAAAQYDDGDDDINRDEDPNDD